jgi:hypothetical protein
MASDALDALRSDERKVVLETAVMAEVVVPRRSEDLLDGHRMNCASVALSMPVRVAARNLTR